MQQSWTSGEAWAQDRKDYGILRAADELDFVFQSPCVWVLTPSTSECDPTLFGNRVGVIQLVKIRSYWSRVGFWPKMTGVLTRRKPCNDRHRGSMQTTTEAETGIKYCQASKHSGLLANHCRLRRSKEEFPNWPRREHSPPWFYTSGLQNYSTVNILLHYIILKSFHFIFFWLWHVGS